MSQDDTYELIYWPSIPGRGEFIRLIFEEAGAPYSDVAKNPDEAMKAVMDYGSAKNLGDDTNPAVFAVPVLNHGDLTIHQTPTILQYLAPKFGLAPKEGHGVWHLNQIVLTILDGLSNEIHDTHHPLGTNLYYEDQKPEAKRRAKSFREERLPKYLRYVQRLLDSKTSGDGPWLYGGGLTYADLVLFQALDGTKFAFPKSIEKLEKSGDYDGVFKLYQAVKERPNIKQYLESDRRAAYSDGIYRYYPELEEE